MMRMALVTFDLAFVSIIFGWFLSWYGCSTRAGFLEGLMLDVLWGRWMGWSNIIEYFFTQI